MYKKYIKRLLDILLSIIGIILLSPILLITAFLIKIDSKGPIIFKQRRFGINKTYFNILKFRTMRIDTPHNRPTHLLQNPLDWITKIGLILRKTSLDELPQLFNILKGDMSFIGPRPALWNQIDLIEARDKYEANNIKPGLTGYAQINGRDELSIEEKSKLDGIYAEKLSFYLDFCCFIKTIFVVLKSKDIVEGKKKNTT